MADGKIHPAIVYRELLAMKKVYETPKPETATDTTGVEKVDVDSTKAPADTTAE